MFSTSTIYCEFSNPVSLGEDSFQYSVMECVGTSTPAISLENLEVFTGVTSVFMFLSFSFFIFVMFLIFLFGIKIKKMK